MDKNNRIMICVTRQRNCERLIQKGRSLVSEIGGELYVVHALKPGENYLGNPNEGEALEYLFQVSKEVGAEMNVLRSKNIVKTLTDFANEQQITTMILGATPESNANNLVQDLKRLLPSIRFIIA